MQEDAVIVVFPSEFAKPKMSRLLSNIKEILRIREQSYEFVKRDGDVLVVRANDPVFASAAINQLFGIQKIAIARKVKPDLQSIIENVTHLGGNLLLRGEKFLVRVEGAPLGFVPKDAEIAITSSIIEKKSNQGATPGSDYKFDKLLYTYITKSSAYVCIFLDKGHGGIPNFSLGSIVCPIYDELSGISCLETIKQGYNVKILPIYKKESELVKLAKILNKVIQFIAKSDIQLEFYDFTKLKITGPYDYQRCIVQLCIDVAKDKISLPLSNQIFPVEFVDEINRLVLKSGHLLCMPLQGKEDQIRDMARQYVLDKFVGAIKIYKNYTASSKPAGTPIRHVVNIKYGPNNIHDILDSLKI